MAKTFRQASWLVLAAAAMSIGGVGCANDTGDGEESQAGTDEAEIRGGASSSFAFVPALYDANSSAFCTGVALSARIVLTAAHCVQGDVRNIRVGTRAQGSLRVVDGLVQNAADWAVLKIASPGLPLTIVPTLATTRPATSTQYLITGYGSDGSFPGIQRYGYARATGVTRPISPLSPNLLDTYAPGPQVIAGPFPPGTNMTTVACPGDSGGPTIAFEGAGYRVYGIASSVAYTGGQTNDPNRICRNVVESYYVSMAQQRPAIVQAQAILNARAN